MKNSWSTPKLASVGAGAVLKRVGKFWTLLAALAVILCSAMSLLLAVSSPARTTRATAGNVASSPSSGPAGATIEVSGYGWQSVPDGTSVFFGYSSNSNCSSNIIVDNSQLGTMRGGSFSGWFHWPAGTLLNTFMVCAIIGSVAAPANTYQVLSASQPTITLSSETLTVGQAATITGYNYLPASTLVPLVLQSGSVGNSMFLGSVISDVNGYFSFRFTAPGSLIGSDIVIANAGKGQPPTLSATAPLIINKAVTITPTPTPTTGPEPNPTPTITQINTPAQVATPTMVPTATATTQTSLNGTSNSPTVTQNPGAGVTPVQGITPTVNSTGGGIRTTVTSPQRSISMPTIVLSVATLLLALLGVWILLTRLRKRPEADATTGFPVNGLPTSNGQMVPLNAAQVGYNTTGGPMNGANGDMLLMSNLPMDFLSPLQLPAEEGAAQQGPISPLPRTDAGSVEPDGLVLVGVGDNGTPSQVNQPAHLDPAIEAMMRQAQAGLYASLR